MFAVRSASPDPYGLGRRSSTSRAATYPPYYPTSTAGGGGRGGTSWDDTSSYYDLPQRSATAVVIGGSLLRSASRDAAVDEQLVRISTTAKTAFEVGDEPLAARSRSGSFSSHSRTPSLTSRAASPIHSPPRPTLAQRISSRIGAELLDLNPTSIALQHTAQADWSTLSSSLISFTSSFLALHDLIPSEHPQSHVSNSLLHGYTSFLTRLQSRCTEYTALAGRMVLLARLSREGGEDVGSAVMQLSESIGRAEEGWRRIQVGYVEWVNGVTRRLEGMARAAMEGGELEGRVQKVLQTLHTSKLAVHESLKTVFQFLNLLSSRGVAIATSLHFRKGSAAEHYFREGEEEEVERVWMDLRAEVESARGTMERLEKAVGGAGNQVRGWEEQQSGFGSRVARPMSRGR